ACTRACSVACVFVAPVPSVPPGRQPKLILADQNAGSDDPPHDWPGGAGNLIKAYRLNDGFEDWAEGNGFNFPTVVYRGDGNGVTWNCSTDTDISNVAADCSGQAHWDNGGQKRPGAPRPLRAAPPQPLLP